MAKQEGNVVTHGLSGMIGGQLVFRQLHGQTFVSTAPRASGHVTENQKLNQRRFQRAVLYGSAVAADPELSATYAAKAKKGQSVRNVAVADFFHAPDIETIDLTNYHGQPGDTIRILVTDDFAVKEVKVVIIRTDGTLVEEGNAQPEATGYEWTYIATQPNDGLEGDRIEVYASDTPGNISQAEQEL
jgi:hypothetical protein